MGQGTGMLITPEFMAKLFCAAPAAEGATRHTHHGRHLDCGGKSDATPLWVGTAVGSTTSAPGRKRRRRCALPAQSITASSKRLATMVRVKSCTPGAGVGTWSGIFLRFLRFLLLESL